MSKKAKTPSFICEIPLVVSPIQEKKLHSKFEVARHFYNQCLAEAKKRLALMQQSKHYHVIRSLPPSQKDEKRKQFQQLLKTFHFQEFDLHSFSKQLRINHLKRKAECAGAEVVEIDPRKTKLSQTCHCGRIKKKKLSERRHECECGVLSQRDLYSAYLARFIDEQNNFHADQATSSWSSADVLLQTAWEKTFQMASVSQVRNSFGNPFSRRQSRSSVTERIENSQAEMVVRPAETLRQLFLFPS